MPFHGLWQDGEIAEETTMSLKWMAKKARMEDRGWRIAGEAAKAGASVS
jgi:hypothetical protein